MTLHAVWGKLPDTGYTVVFWKQSVNDKKDVPEASKTYDYVSSEKRTAPTESQVNVTPYDKNKDFPGFIFNSSKTVSATVLFFQNLYQTSIIQDEIQPSQIYRIHLNNDLRFLPIY